ncbi:MAG: GNAT family protein [Rubrivivax sp.]
MSGAAPASTRVHVLPITEAHVVRFFACLDGVARERRGLAMLEAPPLDRLQAFVREGIVQHAAQVVAELDAPDGDGAVVGWADAFPVAPWPTVAHVGSLGIGVRADWRGRGLGRRLLDACIERAWAAGLTRISLAARADNLGAIRLYEAAGFRHEGRRRGAMRFDGIDHDTVVMGLLCTDPRPGTPPPQKGD